MKRILLFIALMCGMAMANSYTTNFPANETPISENGAWAVQGGTPGLDWKNINSTGGKAIGTQVGSESCPTNCNDSTAIVGGAWGPDQTCQVTVQVSVAPSSGSIFQEAECRVRTTITAHSNTGYELNCSISTNPTNFYMQLVRWDGALGSFTPLTADGGVHHCVNGDVIKLTIVGSVLTAFLNGSQIMTFTDATFTTGNPGIGLFTTGSTGINGNFGISSVTLSDTNTAQWTGILAQSRAIDWTKAGTPWVNRTTACATIAPYTGTALAITTALNSCTAGQYVHLGTGTFVLSNGIALTKSGVTLRGDGADKTFITFNGNVSCGGFAGVFCISNDSTYYAQSFTVQPGVGSNQCAWTAGYAQGATSITVGSCGSAGLPAIGQYVYLDQINDSALAGSGLFVCDLPTDQTGTPNCSIEGNAGGRGASGGGYRLPINRTQLQIVKVTNKVGSVLTITPGLYATNWRSGQSPGIWWVGSPISGVGVEDISYNATNGNCDTTQSCGVVFENAFESWVRGVESFQTQRSHTLLLQSAHNLVEQNAWIGTINATSQSYGVECNLSSDNLIQNNISQGVTVPRMMGSCQGNVYFGNFGINDFYLNQGTDLTYLMQGEWPGHDAGVEYNLFEENIGAGWMGDAFHGSSGANTAFRDRLIGWEPGKLQSLFPVQLFSYNREENFVGNVLGCNPTCTGGSAAQGTYQTSNGVGGAGAIFDLGSGNPNGANIVVNDSYVTTSVLRWGNWDSVNAANRFVSSEVPSALTDGFANPVPINSTLPNSFAYASQPSWWNTPWPGIGPDVTGGNLAGTGGHANQNPAMACFLGPMGGTAGGGSPNRVTSVLTYSRAACFSGATPTANTPTASPVSGTYPAPLAVSLNTASSGAIICYNFTGAPATNGTTGCTTGTKYTTAISIPSSSTLYYVAGGSGYNDSAVGNSPYNVSIPVAAPSGSIAGGTAISGGTIIH